MLQYVDHIEEKVAVFSVVKEVEELVPGALQAAGRSLERGAQQGRSSRQEAARPDHGPRVRTRLVWDCR